MQRSLSKVLLAVVASLGVCWWASAATLESDALSRRPNVLLIVVDDLGFTDLGSFGGEIDTPNLDRLANTGVRFNSFYTAPTCSPTRAMLLSGIDNHLVGLGNMAEMLAPNQKNQPGYEGYLNFRVVTLAELLQDAGYHTYMTGKWHLGLKKNQGPAARGFEKSFALLPSGGGHFNDLGIAGKPALYREDGEIVALPEGFYSTRFYSDKMIQYIEAGIQQGKHQGNKPFFAYLAYSAPHWPLQAPAASIAKYHGRYDAGYGKLHEQRLAGAKALGLVGKHIMPSPQMEGEPTWDQLSEDKKKVAARKMEIYAAMVDDIDYHVGRLINTLAANGQLENTLIVFMSDNGAEGHHLDRDIPPLADWVEQCCDNSFANMGKANSYLWYGPNWARAGMAPFRLHKAFTSEGGIRAPAFISHPQVAKKGGIASSFATVMDIMPTILELVGAEHPGAFYKGKEVLPIQGKSMLSFLQGKVRHIHGADEVMGWELSNKRAIRKGNWKIVMMPEPYGNAKWQLFNLAVDPTEQRDLASKRAGKLKQMIKLWQGYAKENGIIIPNRWSNY